jgi:hypothetical protein
VEEEMKDELARYGRLIRQDGWESGEPMILEAEKRWPDFRRWAHALAIMLRTEEILNDS